MDLAGLKPGTTSAEHGGDLRFVTADCERREEPRTKPRRRLDRPSPTHSVGRIGAHEAIVAEPTPAVFRVVEPEAGTKRSVATVSFKRKRGPAKPGSTYGLRYAGQCRSDTPAVAVTSVVRGVTVSPVPRLSL